jgi:OmpR-family two-component system manganese-sensing response regulator
MQPLKRRLLYVEGYADTLLAISLRLRMAGFDVVTAESIKGGLDLARMGGYDLYLLAGILSDGLGIDLCKLIRDFDTATPIIFFSALAYPYDREAAIAAGAQEYLIKPNDLEILEQAIAKLLGL